MGEEIPHYHKHLIQLFNYHKDQGAQAAGDRIIEFYK